MESTIKECIKSFADFEFIPPVIEKKQRSIASLFESPEISTIKRFEEFICHTSPDPSIPVASTNASLQLFGKVPESTYGYNVSTFITSIGNYEFQEIPTFNPTNVSTSLSFAIQRPSTEDERIRLQIVANRHYIKFLRAKLSLYHIELDNVRQLCSTSDHLSTSYVNYKIMTEEKFEENMNFIKECIDGLPTADDDYKFSSDMLELNGTRTDR